MDDMQTDIRERQNDRLLPSTIANVSGEINFP